MMRPLKIGLLLNTYFESEGLRAGGFVHLFEVVRRWRGVDVTIFAPESGRKELCEAFHGCTFVALPSLDRYVRGTALTFLGRLVRAPMCASRLRSCDVLLVLSPFLPDILPALFFGPKNCAVMLWHLLDLPWKRPGSFANNTMAFINERIGLWLVEALFPVLIAGTAHVTKSRGGLAKKAIFITTNGVDHVRGVRTRNEPRSGTVFLGRLHPSKGVEDLIAAWRLVIDRLGRRTLSIAGGGPSVYRGRLQAQIDGLDLGENVFLLGEISDEEKKRLLHRSELFVFPSYEEGWAIAVGEAMAAGVPCITYDLEVFDEIFPQGRISAPKGSIPDLADRICSVLENPELRTRMSSEAKELSARFSWQRASDIEMKALLTLPAARSITERTY